MKKNIAILVPKLAGGGAERVASNLSIHLDENRYNKYVLVYDADNCNYLHRGKLVALKSKAIHNSFGKIYNLIRRVYKVRKFKKKHNIDTTISLLSGPNIVNILSKRNDTVLVSVRNFISKSSIGFYGEIYNFLIKLFYNKADTVVAVSKTIKIDLIENYSINRESIKVIYNPYDIAKAHEMAEEKINKQHLEIFNNPTIINVGRLTEQKGQWHLLRAFKRVKENIKDVHLVILGEGELKYYLKELAIDLGLKDSVFFLGFKNNPFKYIANSTMFILSSLYEGFPNALVEAMVCKLPVISSDCKSGPREILAPDTDIKKQTKKAEYAEYGVLVPVCDGNKYQADVKLTREEDILANQIIKMLQNQELRNSYCGKSIKRANEFEVSGIVEEWSKLL